jgi:outer membrane protein assembly factor BamB
LYFSSEDTYVYCLNIINGRLEWKCQAQAKLLEGPTATENTVYQFVRGHGLVAVDRKTGKKLWSLPEGVGLLSEYQGRAYVMTELPTLAVLDNSSGEQLYSVNIVDVQMHRANTRDGKIYIADRSGRVAAVEPVSQ